MLKTSLIPRLNNDFDDYIYQKDEAPPHWHLDVHDFLNETLPNRWIGRKGPNDLALRNQLSKSLYLTPYDYFLWGCVKYTVHIPPLPSTVGEFKN